VRAALYVLLVFSALPDAMVPPMLEGLFVARYGVSEGAAHWFMAVNLLGAAVAVPMLGHLRRICSPAALLAGAAAVDAVLLAVMALPIGFGASLAVRVAEGAADLLVFAVLFDLIVKSGNPATRGRRLGLATALLMLAIGAGLGLGGIVGAQQPALVFVVGAAACAAVTLAAVATGSALNSVVRSCPAASVAVHTGIGHRELWPTMSMAAADRAVAGLFIATIPLYFVAELHLSAAQAGGLLGLLMLVMAAGSWPAGVLSDRLGHLRVRLCASLLYVGAVMMLTTVAQLNTAALIALLALIGFVGSALMPTSLALATRTGRGSVAMGALHAAGNVGFFIGIVVSGLLLDALRPHQRGGEAFTLVIIAIALLHVLNTLVTTIALLVMQPGRRASALGAC
jgi:MFS family permease